MNKPDIESLVNYLFLRDPAASNSHGLHSNRLDFIKKYRITKQISNLFPGGSYFTETDHPAFYSPSEPFGPIVFVASNYDLPPPNYYCMKEIAPIYNENAKSFVVVYESKKEAVLMLTAAINITNKLKRFNK